MPFPSLYVITYSLFLLSALCSLTSPLAAEEDPFAAGVRTTPWLSAAEEQKLFKLPEGFEIGLVAAEPQIQKPLNMQFDERGRIWLTDTVEYPYPAPADRPGRDTIKVLEDSDGDGSYEKVTTFADGLNIPIGIYPWRGGCIAFSIPNIWHFEDTDGDGRCDKRTKLYGPFDTSRDTHGMVNALRRGFDGWIYACHGFNNNSRVQGGDGNVVEMSSGNTFRFRPDGGRIEHFTHGQVNPFGMCFDERFDVFTADCHSKPLTQLLRGAYYPSFGRPHDGLGFVPPMMDHLHGSTAICGLAIYSGDNFPPDYRGQFFSGNVMTSRINRNSPVRRGSTVKAKEEADFLVSDDPWFRPVDLHVGPDGALYVLDFYNRIIGHYEVPLAHPGRDRTSGRIWRIAYTGQAGETRPAKMPGDLSKMSLDEQIAQLAHPNLEQRLRAQHYLVDSVGRSAVGDLQRAWRESSTPVQKVHALWALERLQPLDLHEVLASDSHEDSLVRLHSVKALGARADWREQGYENLPVQVHHPDTFIQRAAAEAFAAAPDRSADPTPIAKKLLLWESSVYRGDDLLYFALRMALRNHLATLDDVRSLKASELLQGEGRNLLATLCLSIETAAAARFLLHYVEEQPNTDDRTVAYVKHAARFAEAGDVRKLITVARRKLADNLPLQGQILQAVHAGSLQRGQGVSPELAAWGEDLCRELLKSDASPPLAWTAVPIPDLATSESPWAQQPRPSRDGDASSLFFSSLPRGEQRTGIYRSAIFKLPAKFSFWCAGHDGFPRNPPNGKNLVRLRDAKTNDIQAQSAPPRNDVARRIEWHLPEKEGRECYIELVDGDSAAAYAWLAVGRFSLPQLNASPMPARQVAAAEIVSKLKLASLRPQMANLLTEAISDQLARSAAAQAIASLDSDSRLIALAGVLTDPALPAARREQIAAIIAERSEGELIENLREVMKAAPARQQALLAEILSSDAAGARALVSLMQSGHASARLLSAPAVIAKLQALADERLLADVKELTGRLPPAGETLDKLIAERRIGYALAKPDLARGREVFTKNCAACHQLGGKGTVVGPQLDGIGSRGLDRLLEDVLDPNRNVDIAFRTTTLVLADGRIVSGLVRREEGAAVVLCDNKGQEFTVAKADIDQQQKTPHSLMPSNVGETLPADELHDLLAFLLIQQANSQGKPD